MVVVEVVVASVRRYRALYFANVIPVLYSCTAARTRTTLYLTLCRDARRPYARLAADTVNGMASMRHSIKLPCRAAVRSLLKHPWPNLAYM